MTHQPNNSGSGKAASPRRSPFQLLWPIGLGLLVGSAIYGGYYVWWHHKTEQQALAAATGDADMAKPTADECAIARVALTAVHVANSDKAWESAASVSEMSFAPYSKVVNPADLAGFTDEEEDNLRAKGAADWRWCPGMSSFVGGLGWKPMGGDDPIAAVALGRPGVSRAGDEARLYQAFLAPRPESGVMKLARGPWLVTLHKGANGAWQVVSSDDLKRANH